ncbi:MAG: type II toxin-antitoxin system prevent-host-death family antitoxin [Vicinamibacteria bacterium]|nr:type II toxin-antitoxin system prevent-host-death family antitoxin [Vicinamibacteria bacterium]
MIQAGIRELKDNLSRYVREAEAGQRVAITAHGRVVAELTPPAGRGRPRGGSRLQALVSAGLAQPPTETGDPTRGWPSIRLPKGTVAALIDADRGE